MNNSKRHTKEILTTNFLRYSSRRGFKGVAVGGGCLNVVPAIAWIDAVAVYDTTP